MEPVDTKCSVRRLPQKWIRRRRGLGPDKFCVSGPMHSCTVCTSWRGWEAAPVLSTPTRFRQSLVDSIALVGTQVIHGANFLGVLDPSWPQISSGLRPDSGRCFADRGTRKSNGRTPRGTRSAVAPKNKTMSRMRSRPGMHFRPGTLSRGQMWPNFALQRSFSRHPWFEVVGISVAGSRIRRQQVVAMSHLSEGRLR
jgi:hypothetical protein